MEESIGDVKVGRQHGSTWRVDRVDGLRDDDDEREKGDARRRVGEGSAGT